MITTRLSSVRGLLANSPAEGLLVTYLPHIRWLTGFTGSNALVYVDSGSAVFITDGRYTEQVRDQVQGFTIHIAKDQTKLLEHLKPASSVGYDSSHTSVAQLAKFERVLASTKLVSTENVFSSLMAVKTDDELAAIKHAQAVTDQVFSEMLEILRPGLTEREVATQIVYRQLRAGADMISPEFWPIVASGYRSALPHATPTGRKLEHGELVLLDFGCMVDGYNSDMTRVVALGNPGKKARDIYDTVLKAQIAALAAAKAGVTGKSVDTVARDIIEVAGYALPHGLGHGVGLEVHEDPVLAPRNTAPLPAGAVVTVEPGIYLPGEFGVRIEDMVILTETGCTNLTESPKDLIML